MIAKIEIVLEVSSPSPPTIKKNVNAVAVRKKERGVGRGRIHRNRLYKVDEGKNNVAHRCEGRGEGECTVPFFWRDGRRVETKLKRVHEFLIKKHRTIFPFFCAIDERKIAFQNN